MKRIIVATLIMIVSFSAAANIAGAAAIKIGVIDMQRLIKESKAAQDLRGVFLMDLENKRNVLQAKESQVRKMRDDLRKKAKGKSAEEIQAAQEQLQQEVKALRRLKADLQEELKKKDVELTQKLVKEVREIVEAYKKRKKFTIILQRKTVVAFDTSIDITGDIIKEFDKKKR